MRKWIWNGVAACVFVAVWSTLIWVIAYNKSRHSAALVSRMQIESLTQTDTGCRIRMRSGRTYQARVSCEEIVRRSYSSIFVELGAGNGTE